jgi:hypothetical protein
MPRRTISTRLRVAAAVLGAGAIATVLSACDKPTPNITVFTGRTTIQVSPAKYCYDGNANTCRTTSAAGSITATSGSTIVVDVPREVADNHWAVAAFVKDSTGKITTIDSSSSAVVSKTHSVRLLVPQASSGSYQLSVQSFTGAAATGEWDVEVTLNNTA